MDSYIEYDYKLFRNHGQMKPPLYGFDVGSRLLSVETLRPSQTVKQTHTKGSDARGQRGSTAPEQPV